MPNPILNIADVEFRKVGHGSNFPGAEKAPEKFSAQVGDIGRRIEGEVRIGPERFPIKQGDVIAHPPGGPETAHQIVNTSNAELKYLAISTLQMPEICDYPDSNKFAVMTMRPGPDGKPKFWRFAAREGMGVDYFDGE
jgi:uncharacterized cupin superfamily protein